jgi:hypothetical protein
MDTTHIKSLLLSLLLASSATAAEPALTLQHTIDLPGVKGRFDHFAIDHRTSRLFVAALGTTRSRSSISPKHSRLSSLPNIKEPQGLAYAPAGNLLYVAAAEMAVC